jgi:hypothetical protein
LIELRVITKRGGGEESRTVRVKITGPRMRPIGKITILVIAGLVTALILHRIG